MSFFFRNDGNPPHQAPLPRRRRDAGQQERDGGYHSAEEQLFALWREIERKRQQLDQVMAAFKVCLQDEPELYAKWQKFTTSGGLTVDEFDQFLQGNFRPRLIRRKRHLRLVANRKTKPVRNNRGDNDVA